MANSDYLYENPPLMEVISEIRWSLTKLSIAPGAGIDPNYALFEAAFLKQAIEGGFSSVQQLVPNEVPREFLAGQPIYQLRVGANSWPLLQIGPGLLTANLTPPYNGWDEYKKLLSKAWGLLRDCYPQADTQLKIEKISLRYIDAFSEKHGLKSSYGEFIQRAFTMKVALPKGIESSAAGDFATVVSPVHIFQFPLRTLDNSTCEIKIVPGNKGSGERAVLVEFGIHWNLQPTLVESEAVFKWFDAAHLVLRDFFEDFITKEVRQTFGERRTITTK